MLKRLTLHIYSYLSWQRQAGKLAFILFMFMPLFVYGNDVIIEKIEYVVYRSHLLPVDLNKVLDVTFRPGGGKWFDASTNEEVDNIVIFDPANPQSEFKFVYRMEDYASDCWDISKGNAYEVVIIIDDIDPPTGESFAEFCYRSGDKLTLHDLRTEANVVGERIKWYESATGGNPLDWGDTLVHQKKYYASQTIYGKGESTVRLAVEAILNLKPILVLDIDTVFAFNRFDLRALNVVDLNYTAGTITFHSAMPVDGEDMSHELRDFTVGETQRVYIMKTTEHGCYDILSVVIKIGDDLVIPDGFSPNDDGVNDQFVIKGLSDVYPNAYMEIYNRWGVLIYSKEHYGNEYRWGRFEAWWNGLADESKLKVFSKDKLLPVGTYFYILVLDEERDYIKRGTIFLNR